MKRIAILGSTGSVGCSALRVVDHLPGRFEVVALSAYSNIDRLEEQARRYGARRVAVVEPAAAARLAARAGDLEVLSGLDGVCALAGSEGVDQVIAAIVGAAGVRPTYVAIDAGKEVALANKEALVLAGALLMERARERGATILPLDSEHSALFQSLHGEDPSRVRRLILTCSGGPFRECSEEQLRSVTVERALAHPNWSMGAKVTIDCSTLMNKGLEVIEARWLFDLPVDKIEVVIHPQSLIHSMVEYVDGSIMAQMAEPDMVLPVQYAMTYPERLPGLLEPFDFTRARRLDFLPPNKERFPCLSLAYRALEVGGTLACYMNAANEVLVNRFAEGAIGWREIGERLERLMASHQVESEVSLDRLLEIDQQARREAERMV